MTYAPRPREFVPCSAREAPGGGVAARRPGLLRRIYDAVVESREKQAEREIVHYLERTGGRFTDEIERRLTGRLISGDWQR